MAKQPVPRALLFDIGGVCVLSPLRAILDYELAHRIPPGWVNFSISRTSPSGSWHQLERGEVPLDASFFRAFSADLHRPDLWRQHVERSRPSLEEQGTLASFDLDPAVVPSIDAEFLFWEMMRISRTPDPHMAPALAKLRASRAFLLAALSNTVIFPPGHAYAAKSVAGDVRDHFDEFVSSAHSGVRKPAREAYALALAQMRAHIPDLQPGEVLFLDDIGENLKGGRAFGFRTLRVWLGRTDVAVKELGELLGMDLGGAGTESKL